MAYQNEKNYLSFMAATDLTAFRFRALRLSAENFVNVASNNGANTFIGVLDNDPSSGAAARVTVSGVTKIYAGGSITAGALVTHNGSGQAVAATSGQLVIGRALTGAASGDLVTMVQPFMPFFAAISV